MDSINQNNQERRRIKYNNNLIEYNIQQKKRNYLNYNKKNYDKNINVDYYFGGCSCQDNELYGNGLKFSKNKVYLKDDIILTNSEISTINRAMLRFVLTTQERNRIIRQMKTIKENNPSIFYPEGLFILTLNTIRSLYPNKREIQDDEIKIDDINVEIVEPRRRRRIRIAPETQ